MARLPGRLAIRLATALVIALSIGSCGVETAPSPTFDPGISGPSLAGSLEVIVVDESTRQAIPARVEIVHASGTIEATGDGPLVFEDAALTGAIAIHVLDVDRPQAWVGVTGSRVVIPIARPAVRTIEGEVRGAAALGASDVVVGPLVPVSFVRTDVLAHASPSPCTLDATGCRFRIDDAPASSDAVIATLRDGSGAAVAFGIGQLDGSAGATVLELTDPAMRAPAVEVPIASPPTPPVGLSAVVGVPGLATSAGVAFLDQVPSSGAVGVPELAGTIGDGSWWLLAEAATSFTDRARRSVVLQRGLRAPDEAGTWPAWLEVPELAVGASTELTPAEGATLHAIDWLAPNGAVLASALVLAADAPISFAPAVSAVAIRVRAIDAPGASGALLDLASVDRSVTRFSESTIDL